MFHPMSRIFILFMISVTSTVANKELIKQKEKKEDETCLNKNRLYCYSILVKMIYNKSIS
jgi:hypothetical protein